MTASQLNTINTIYSKKIRKLKQRKYCSNNMTGNYRKRKTLFIFTIFYLHLLYDAI